MLVKSGWRRKAPIPSVTRFLTSSYHYQLKLNARQFTLYSSTILVIQSSLVRAIRYSTPSVVTVGQPFTVTWFEPPQSLTQFGIGVVTGADSEIEQEDLTAINPGGDESGTIILTAPDSPG